MTRARAPHRERDRIEELAQSVVRALRHALDRGRFGADDAVDVAAGAIHRAGSGPRLSDEKRVTLRHALVQLSSAIEPSQPRTLLAFARAAAEAAWKLMPPKRHPGAGLSSADGGAADADARTLARAALFATAANARDPEDHVQRAVTRALRERKRAHGQRRLPLDDGDPLRALLDVPRKGSVRLPKTDVRMRIAEAASSSALFGNALRAAARFSEELLRPALGEELWSIARPTGFSDQKETRVVVEVRSPLLAHEVQLRSQELLHRLRAVPGFGAVDAIKLVVVQPAALPVVGAPPSTVPITRQAPRGSAPRGPRREDS